MEKVSAKMTSLQTEVSKKLNENHDLKCQYVYKIYGELVKKFLMVFFAQFRKDVKSSYHVEKTIAHRKQIQLSVSKKKSSLKSKTSTAQCSPNRESVSDNVPTPLSECCSVPSAEVTTATDISTDVTTTSETGGTTSVEEASTSCAAEASTSYTAESSTSSTSKKPRKKKRQATGRKRKAKGKAAATNTSGSYDDETGETIWVCPSCNMEDDGIQHMIGCDICDDWYHWNCVGITAEPEEELWFCPGCDTSTHKSITRRGRKM